MSAFGTTPALVKEKILREHLILYGNVLQGTGNALLADTEEPYSLGRIGNEIQAAGNTMVVMGIMIDFKEETKSLWGIKGNLFQAVGGGVVLSEELEEQQSLLKTYNVIGNLL